MGHGICGPPADSLLRTPHIEVVVARLPEGRIGRVLNFVRYVLFQHLKRDCQSAALGFGQQQVDVFRHDDVSDDEKSVPAADLLKSLFEDVARLRRREQWCPTITTESDEVKVAGLLETVESAGHQTNLFTVTGFYRDGNHTSVSTVYGLRCTHPVRKERGQGWGTQYDLFRETPLV